MQPLAQSTLLPWVTGFNCYTSNLPSGPDTLIAEVFNFERSQPMPVTSPGLRFCDSVFCFCPRPVSQVPSPFPSPALASSSGLGLLEM